MEAGTMTRTLEESRAFFAADRFAMEACGITIDEVTEDGARCSMPLTPMHLNAGGVAQGGAVYTPVSYTHLRAHETGRNLVCRLLLEKKKQKKNESNQM